LEDAAILLVTITVLGTDAVRIANGDVLSLRNAIRFMIKCVRTDVLARCVTAFEERPRTSVASEPYNAQELADFLREIPTPSAIAPEKDVRNHLLKSNQHKEVLQQRGLSKGLFALARKGLSVLATQWSDRDPEAHFAEENRQIRLLWLLRVRQRGRGDLSDEDLALLRRGISDDDMRQIEMRCMLPSTFLAQDATRFLGCDVLRCAVDVVTADRVIPLMGRVSCCVLPHMLGVHLVGVMGLQVLALRLPCMEEVTEDLRTTITDSHAFAMLENLHAAFSEWSNLGVSMTFSAEAENLRVVRVGGSSIYSYVMPFPTRIAPVKVESNLRLCFAAAAKKLIGDKLDCGVWRGWGVFLKRLTDAVDGARIPPFPRMVASKPLSGDGSSCPPIAVSSMEVDGLTYPALLGCALEPDYRESHGFEFAGPIDWPLQDTEKQDNSTYLLLSQYHGKPLTGGLISTPKDVTFSGTEEADAQGQGVYAALVRRMWGRILAHAFILVDTNTYILAPLTTCCTVEPCMKRGLCPFRLHSTLAQIGTFYMETLAQGHRPPVHLHPSVVCCLTEHPCWERVLLDCSYEGLERVRGKNTVWPLLPYPNVENTVEEGYNICEDPVTHDLLVSYDRGKQYPLPLPGWVMPACAFPYGGKEFATKLGPTPLALLEHGYLEQLGAAISDSEPAMAAVQSGMKERPGVFTLLRDSSLCAVLELASLPACDDFNYEFLAAHLTIKLHSANHTTSPERMETLSRLIHQRLREDRALRLKLVLETCEGPDLQRAVISPYHGISIAIASDGALIGTDTHTCWFETTLFDVPGFEASLVGEMNKWGTRQILDGDVEHAST
jgi:hypothetical protein